MNIQHLITCLHPEITFFQTPFAVIAKAPAGKTLELGHLMDITLDPAKKVPAVSDDAKIWEGSRGYGERGTFAWNQLSKNLALFYSTGDEKFAQKGIEEMLNAETYLQKRNENRYYAI